MASLRILTNDLDLERDTLTPESVMQAFKAQVDALFWRAFRLGWRGELEALRLMYANHDESMDDEILRGFMFGRKLGALAEGPGAEIEVQNGAIRIMQPIKLGELFTWR